MTTMIPLDLKRFEELKVGGDLPSPKGAALAIVRLTQKEDVSLAELAHAVSTDPAFVGRLIKAANSAQATGRRPVASIQDALSVLGIATVRTLALGFSLVSDYKAGKCSGFDYARFWSHSLACAIALQSLVKKMRLTSADEAFCVGLLARVGQLAMATVFPDDYKRVLESTPDELGAALFEPENETFGLNHAQMTSAMLLDWGLPKTLCDPVLHHEVPEDSPFEEGNRAFMLTHALALAEQVADVCVAEESEWRAMMPTLLLMGSRLSIDSEGLMALCDLVVREWQEWGALLNISTQSMPPFAEMTQAPAAPMITEGGLLDSDDKGYRMRLLVVDDDRTMRTLIATLLRNVGHEVIEAENGRVAFDLAIEMRPQIVVTDWMMPEMNGLELTRALRETTLGKSTYIIILTALEDEGALVEAFRSGVDDFLSKPLKPEVFTARLRAGQRVVKLQQELERDRDELRRFAAELAVVNRKHQHLALTDVLTGFPNRRYAMERIQQEWAVSTRNKRALSCMMVDVDDFKQINDTAGHDVGDRVLQQAASAIKQALRTQDVVCRIGGDEFLVISPDTGLDAALLGAERIRKAVAALELESRSGKVQTSVSIGVAQRVASMVDPQSLVKRADEGVYRAKASGRNRVAAVQVEAKSKM